MMSFLLRLGRLYQKGWGVAHDQGRAVALYEQAAAHGNLVAKGALGWQWMRGRCGVRKMGPGLRLWARALWEIVVVCKEVGRNDERVLP